jgi:hypothetical protein
MEKIDNVSGKKDMLRRLTVLTLVLLIISFLWIFYTLYAFLEIRMRVPFTAILGNLIGFGYIVRVLLYISFTSMILSALKRSSRSNKLMTAGFITCIFSAISLFFEFAALSDIGDDYLVGGYECTLEWTYLFGSLILNILFLVIAFILVIRTLRSRDVSSLSPKSVVDGVIFEVSQYAGIVCGLTGLVFTLYAYIVLRDFSLERWLQWLLVFYSAAIILPYIAIIVYWIVRLIRKKDRTSYDEMQKNYIASSGMTAWLFSLPLMTVIFLLTSFREGLVVTMLWFPFYLFATLLVFSVSLLLRFRKK